MKFSSSRNILALAVTLASHGAYAADTYLNVFFGDNPMQGVTVTLDGETVSETDARGSAAMLDTSKGYHRLELIRKNEVLTNVAFDIVNDYDTEINVTFVEGDEPKIDIGQYAIGDTTPTGFIGGIITDFDNTPIPGAKVIVTDTDIETTTDAEGAYEVRVPRGLHNLKITHPNFANKAVDGLLVKANLGVSASTRLAPYKFNVSVEAPKFAGAEEEVVTIGTYRPTETSSSIERFSTTVVDALDMEQLSRVGDSNVAGALTRLAGVTVTSGKYANVRGLDGRYVSSSLNGFVMPSTDPFRRDVQLDLFPSDILGGIEVQKSYSSDQLGTTTGGSLKINTLDLPDESTTKFSFSIGGNSEVTGKNLISHEGGDNDWLGFDDGSRELPNRVLTLTDGLSNAINILPSSICNASTSFNCITTEQAIEAATYLPVNFEVTETTGKPDFGISAAHGNLISLSSVDFGYYGTLSYDANSSVHADGTYSDPIGLEGVFTQAEDNVSLKGYGVLGIETDTLSLLSKTLFLRESEKSTRVEEYTKDDQGINQVSLDWVEREFLSQQFIGNYELETDAAVHEFDLRLGVSKTNRNQPDRRNYVYLNGFLTGSNFERRWSDLNEESIDLGFDYNGHFELTDDINTTLESGILTSNKDRQLEMYRLKFSNGDNISELDLSINNNINDVLSHENYELNRIQIAPNTQPTDSYNAEEKLSAFYVNSNTEFGDSWIVLAGARQENFSQGLTYPNSESSNAPELDESNLLPSLSVTYILDDIQFRAGWSQTVSYPGITERSNSSYYDDDNKLIVGNSNLKVSHIDNIDFRVEYYLSNEENISLAVFDKSIENPIEKTIVDGSGSAANGFTFDQSPSATITGLEIDFTKNMFETDSWFSYVSGNISHITSEVEFTDDQRRLEGEDDVGRELQGQSPNLANLQFGFDHIPTDQKITLLINYFDDRIYSPTRGDARTPIYELGRTTVNINYDYMITDNLTVKAKAKNLLNEKVEREQNGRVIEAYTPGIEISASVSYQF